MYYICKISRAVKQKRFTFWIILMYLNYYLAYLQNFNLFTDAAFLIVVVMKKTRLAKYKEYEN